MRHWGPAEQAGTLGQAARGDPHRSPDSTTRGRGSSRAHPHGWRRYETRQTRSWSGRASRRGGRQTQQPQAGALSYRQDLPWSYGAAHWGMARCHTVHGAGFCRTCETVHQVSDPWALQAAVQIKTDPLLQVRKRFALSRPVRRAVLLLQHGRRPTEL